MAEPLKSLFNVDVIAAIGHHLRRAHPAFDCAGFEADASDGLEALELKARAAQITRALRSRLPEPFPAACAVLTASLHPDGEGPGAGASDMHGLRGWAVMPLADYVAAHGAAQPDVALATLAAMTRCFTAEFAVRPFLARDPEHALAFLARCATDPDWRVRRLASEGSRPRLPWGLRLQAFVADPAPLLPLLETLRDDPCENVRRSVANSLNDIAKDHPDRVAAIAARWLSDAPPERRRLVAHACRTLVKQCHPGALAALGLDAAPVALLRLETATPNVRFGTALEITAELRLGGKVPRRIALDYVVFHRKANGTLTPKVFKWTVMTLAPGQTRRLDRRHPMRPITTRRYFDGPHRLEIVANGSVLGGLAFELTGATGLAAH